MLFICLCIGFTLLPLGNVFTRDAQIRYLNAFMTLKVKIIFVYLTFILYLIIETNFFDFHFYKVSLTHEKETYLHSASYITADNLIILNSRSGYRMILASNR